MHLRKIAVLAVALAALAAFTGCSNGNTKAEPSVADNEQSVTEDETETAEASQPDTEAATETPTEAPEPADRIKVEYEIDSSKYDSVLTLWNDTDVKKQIVTYVAAVTDENSEYFIPEEDRIVVTDIDGTMIGESGTKVNNDDMCLKSPQEALEYVKSIQGDTFSERIGITYGQMAYEPMKELYAYLIDNGFQVYFVSGNCNSLTYALANNYFGADYAHSIGSNVELQIDESHGYNVVPTGSYEGSWNEVKCYRIYNQIGKRPVMAFGNSDGDTQMLRWVADNETYPSAVFMINHDDKEREVAYDTSSISKICEKYEFTDVLMSENFKEVFGE